MRLVLLIVTLLVWIPGHAKTFHSKAKPPILIELYSSEGCSSCPPAERQIGELLKSKDLWTQFVPVNFHVDYWNRLGWVDPFSQKKFTQRQRAYARSWGAKTVYTPAFVNNGKKVGPSLNLNEKGGRSPLASAPKMSVEFDKFEVRVQVDGEIKQKNLKLHFAHLGNGLISKIDAGENSGKTLEQNFTVLDYQTQTLANGSARFRLKPLASKAKPKSQSFAAWLTLEGQQVPLQVMGGHL